MSITITEDMIIWRDKYGWRMYKTPEGYVLLDKENNGQWMGAREAKRFIKFQDSH